MATPRVKAEPGIKPEPGVKLEPGVKAENDDVGASPMSISEDGYYMDAGDLEFYNPSDATNDVFLTHVPKYLYDSWAHLDDDAEIRIGTVRQWNVPDPTKNEPGRLKPMFSILLDHQLAQHQQIPKEYNLDCKEENLKSTYLFTEQDLPGYKSKGQGPNNDIPAYLRPKPERVRDNSQPEANNKHGRKGRYQPYYRKAIPKKTILAGRFRHELNCQPAFTDEYKHWFSTRNTDAMKPRATTTLTSNARPDNLITAGSHISNDRFANFVRTAPEPKKSAKKAKEEKAARIPRAELRDQIFKCFETFNYWSMKAFKQQLKQPEAWLRENLEEVAVLHKTGRFANHWELNPDHRAALSALGTDGAAPTAEMEGEESESDAEMEDVV
ncbi:transcription initiation factor iif [Hypoxylon sp. FL1284]|nr:transcription initiation factor iif [Hypoxylon sp. FL1284]